MPHGLWDLGFPPETEPGSTAVKAPSRTHWAARGFPRVRLIDLLSGASCRSRPSKPERRLVSVCRLDRSVSARGGDLASAPQVCPHELGWRCQGPVATPSPPALWLSGSVSSVGGLTPFSVVTRVFSSPPLVFSGLALLAPVGSPLDQQLTWALCRDTTFNRQNNEWMKSPAWEP